MKTFSISNSIYTAAVLALSVTLFSCGKDDDHHHPDHEHEVITTLRLNLYNSDSTDVRQITFRDLDGPGGADGIILPDTLRLMPGTAYTAYLHILDESNPNDIHNVGLEIEDEADEHQFFYDALQGLNLTFSNFDQDDNGLPLGMNLTITTPAQPARGSLRISLSHYSETPKNGVTPSGETDIEVVFPVSVEL